MKKKLIYLWVLLILFVFILVMFLFGMLSFLFSKEVFCVKQLYVVGFSVQ